MKTLGKVLTTAALLAAGSAAHAALITDISLTHNGDTVSLVSGGSIGNGYNSIDGPDSRWNLDDWNGESYFGEWTFNFTTSGASATDSLELVIGQYIDHDLSSGPASLNEVFSNINSGIFLTSDDTVSYTYTSSLNSSINDLEIGLSVASATPVPVPAALWMLGSGVVALAGIRARRISQAEPA